MAVKHPRRRPVRAGRVAPTRRRFPAVAEVAVLEARLLLSALPTTTTLSASPASPPAHQPVTLTATVADAPGSPTPTGGTVTFRDGANAIGTATLANGAAHFTTAALTAGNHEFSAEYAGDGANFLGSTSLVSPSTPIGIAAGNVLFGDSGPATSASISFPTAVAVDAAGDVFIADTFHSVIREVKTDGTITTVAATTAALLDPQGLAVDSSGDLFIADTGNNLIREVKAGVLTTIVSTGLNSPRGLALDSAGNLYIADTGDNEVRKLAPGASLTTVVAGNGTAGDTGDGVAGGATSAELKSPTAVAVDPVSGALYIADSGNNAIRKLAGTTITTMVTGLSFPQGVVADASGNLFVADSGHDEILRVNGGTKNTIIGTGTPGYGGDNGPGTAALVRDPEGLAITASGHLFIADAGNNLIRREIGNTVSTVAGAPNPSRSGEGGPATGAVFSVPQGVATDAAGDFFVVDSGDNDVRKVTSAGTITTVAGAGTQGFSGDGGAATAAQLSSPRGVAVDAAGDLFIADTNNAVIRKVTPTGVISTIAGLSARSGNSGDGGQATLAKLSSPTGVAVDAAGDVFIADTGNNEVREVLPNGTIVDFAGAASPLHAVTLNAPQGVAVDAAGDLLIADTGDNRVVEVRKSDGAVFVVAGTGTAGDTGDGGLATAAQLNAPKAVTVDSSGDLLIADGAVNGVRMVTPGGLIVSINASRLPGPGGLSAPLQPSGVAVDASGNLLIADSFGAVVRKVALQALTVNGGPVATTTIAGPSTFTPVRNQTMTIFAVVSAPAGQPAPTGTVTFKFGTLVIATEPLVTANGTTFASLPTPQMSMGTYTFTTVYNGDATHLGSSASTTFTVGKDATTTVVAPSDFAPTRGESVFITAVVSVNAPGAGAPTGTVSFMSGSVVVATEPILTSGTIFYARLPAVPFGMANYAITAVYNGDAGDTTSSSTTNFTVGPDVTSTVAVASPTAPVQGQAVTLTAAVNVAAPGAGLPTGTITFKDGATVLGTGSLTIINGIPFATFTTSTLSVGSHSITATYGGDAGDKASASAAFTLTVSAGSGRAAPGLAAAPAIATAAASAPAVAPASPVLLAASPPAVGMGMSAGAADRTWLAAIVALADERLG